MGFTEILLAVNSAALLYVIWRLENLDEDLQELGEFSIKGIYTLSKKVEKHDEEFKNISD